MNKKEVSSLKEGLYYIFWKEGGWSYVSVGVTKDGGRWIAPTNWCEPALDQTIWKKVESVKLIV
ncbi:hypothetical protein JRA67_002531 [Acinetobacter baumannii]|uniref:hypothetical protein n=1 Tax=Acinetobacter baumannii TaxID=470 RepID=UPI00044B43A2|nr:hypothetical protein [Acinetobacter baumannii]EKU3485961.1 hypothetical protein [Acinetobacter baumannii]EKX1186610.1 hypothetical protein [Acinetobacter baumannii]EKX4747590.1 hypothetical protein [Acinetobacter baumannii]EXF20265.1 hypothetical protein J601_2391 [Acinetobacter baumannii 831240]MCT9451339.1 hypothetical protein [Acinetobacter baumannii]